MTLEGKTILITGATNGIGRAIAHDLAAMGPRVILVSRSAEKCATVAAELQAETGNADIVTYAADLSSQADVRRLVETLNADLDRLDVLVNNAGAWFMAYQTNADGVEMTWALNHMGYFMLTHGLLDLLKRTASAHGEARIINQSSMAHMDGTIRWDDLEFSDGWGEASGSFGPGWAAYSQSKLANVLHAFELAHQLEGTGVVANAVHPGVVVTGFASNNNPLFKLVAPIRRLFNRATPSDGAAPAVYLASAPEAATISGAYYGPPNRREDVNAIALDREAQQRLWALSIAAMATTA